MKINERVSDEPMTHELKIYPEFFSAVVTGVKRAELRKNDRDYRVGDKLHLMETPRGSCHSTGEYINATITHIADVNEWMPGYVLLSIERELQQYRAAAEKPVAFTEAHEISNMRATGLYLRAWPADRERNEAEGYTIPLYAAPQVTSVPEEATPESIEILASIRPPHGVAFQLDGYERKLASDIWNACRGAMLTDEG